MVTIGIARFNVTKILYFSFHILLLCASYDVQSNIMFCPHNKSVGPRKRGAFAFLHCMDFKILLDVTNRTCSNTGNSK